MNYKKLGKLLGITVICIGAVLFLYSRMQIDYGQYETKEEETKQGQNQEKDLEFPKTYQKSVNDQLSFDVEVVCDKGVAAKGAPKATASVVSLDQQKIYEYFMGESKNVQKEINDNYRDMNGKADTVIIYKDDGDSELWIADKEGTYSQPLMNYIYNSFFVSKSVSGYNEGLYSKTSDLPFMSRTEAWDALTGILGKIDVDLTNIKKKRIYSLDWETLQKEETYIDVDGNIVEEEKKAHWSEADEGYYYFLGQQLQEIPIYEDYKVGQEEEIGTAPICVYQTRDGIAFFYISRWFSVQEQKETYQLAPFEKIMEAVEEKYTGTVKSNPLKVEKAVLYEFPLNVEDNSYTLVPVWVCSIAEELPGVDGQPYTNYLQIPVNAVTGEEMPELEE